MKKNKKIMMVVFVIAVFVLIMAVLFFVLTKRNFDLKGLRDLSGPNGKVSETSDTPAGNETATTSAQEELNLPENLPENLRVAKLKPKDENLTGDEATFIAVLEKDRLTIAIEADLPQPPGTNHYAAWLTKGDGSYFSLGKLEKAEDNFGISANIQGDFSLYKTAIVSLETQDDKKLEKVILEGSI